MSLSLKLLSAGWAHPLFLPSQPLRAAANCLRIDDLSADPEETETSVTITGAHDTHPGACREPSLGGGRVYSGRHSVCMQHRRLGARGLDQYSED